MPEDVTLSEVHHLYFPSLRNMYQPTGAWEVVSGLPKNRIGSPVVCGCWPRIRHIGGQ